jgi:cytochrome c
VFRGASVRPAVLAIAMMSAAGVAQGQSQAQAAQELLRQYKCYICHSDDETKTGPAYIDVAKRYRGNPQAVAIVAGVVRKGASSGGPWHMPPHPEISSRDATTMARYILSLKK